MAFLDFLGTLVARSRLRSLIGKFLKERKKGSFVRVLDLVLLFIPFRVAISDLQCTYSRVLKYVINLSFQAFSGQLQALT